MPKLIVESEYVERDDVKAVIKLFEDNQVMRYSEIRRELGLKKSEFKPYDMRPVTYEVELVRILKRLVKFKVLFKSKIGTYSFYRLNPLKYRERASRAERQFADVKEAAEGIEKRYMECREQVMALILENSRLKERLSRYEDAWVVDQG